MTTGSVPVRLPQILLSSLAQTNTNTNSPYSHIAHYSWKNRLATTPIRVRKLMSATVSLIKGQPLIELSITKGGAALSNKIKILFLRRAAAPLV